MKKIIFLIVLILLYVSFKTFCFFHYKDVEGVTDVNLNGNITINANLYFYGNVIGQTVDASSKTIYAFPFSDLVGSDTLEDVILPESQDEVINDIVLVE